MAPKRHYYEITTNFAPRDLFLLLKKICDEPELRKQGAAFDFDWLKRRVELSAKSRDAAEDGLEILLTRLKAKAGGGLLLPGDAQEKDGRTVIPVGVLLQSPEVYAELLANALTEFGLPNVTTEYEGNGLSLPAGKMTAMLQYETIISQFPLPGYLKIEDRGVR